MIGLSQSPSNKKWSTVNFTPAGQRLITDTFDGAVANTDAKL